ncbi:ACT domain-containing protein, partial [Chloroflexota bacterium]
EEKINIVGMNVIEHNDHTTTINLTLETKGLAQLSRLFARVAVVRGVHSVFRAGGDTTVKHKPPL